MWASERQPSIQIRRREWQAMLRELAARGAGRRESGAFLLGHARRRRPRVSHIAYFDDLEPASLNGAVHLTHVAYSGLWALCSQLGVEVLGDVHTHPGTMVHQSHIDQDNPLVAQIGHVALVVPRYAQGAINAQDVGVYEYLGDNGWRDLPSGVRHQRFW